MSAPCVAIGSRSRIRALAEESDVEAWRRTWCDGARHVSITRGAALID